VSRSTVSSSLSGERDVLRVQKFAARSLLASPGFVNRRGPSTDAQTANAVYNPNR
jgi:hypothetical protein